jgi:hypothetical protein
VRHRRESSEQAPQPTALQLVETQAAANPQPVEDDLPRRSKPRKRRGAAADAEPLMLVETQPTNDTTRGDNLPTT